MRKKRASFIRSILCFLLLLLASTAAPANKILLLSDKTEALESIDSYTLEDSGNVATIAEILRPEWQRKFETHNVGLNYNANKKATYWKKIEIQNHSSHTTWLLEFPDPHIEYVQVYWVKNGNLREFPAAGYGMPFSSRSMAHKNFVYQLNIPEGQSAVVYAKIFAHDRFCSIDANLRSTQNFSRYFLTEYHVLGLYYGIILILVIYNFFLGFFLHEKVHFYYCLYTVCCALFTYSEDGLAMQWIWPNAPFLNSWLIKYSSPLLLFSFLLYSDRFIELKANFPKIRPYIWGSYLLFIGAFFSVAEQPKVIHLLYVLPFSITCLGAIRVYRNGFRAARFYVVGNSMIVFSFVIYYLRINGWIDSNAFTVYMFNYAFVFEATVLSMALADKVKTTKLQSEFAQRETIRQLRINEELQQKVNKELEEKVQERTKELMNKAKELTTANGNLEALKKQLYDMNSKMDINIWELKKEVKKETEARILNNLLPYEDFIAIYPDNKCYDYLKDLKWKNGFTCLKCGNKKCGRGNNAHTFKCTQCQHQHSVTSNTLFHGLKFPISKAFYLAYFLSRNERKISYEELSEKLGLNKNTVWNFDKKLKEGLSNNTAIPDWETLLLGKN
jgi:hypothetical protein